VTRLRCAGCGRVAEAGPGTEDWTLEDGGGTLWAYACSPACVARVRRDWAWRAFWAYLCIAAAAGLVVWGLLG